MTSQVSVGSEGLEPSKLAVRGQMLIFGSGRSPLARMHEMTLCGAD